MSDSCPYCPPAMAWGGSPEMFESLKKWHDSGHPPKTTIQVSGLVGAKPLATAPIPDQADSIEAFIEKVMLVHSEYVEADDELSSWHITHPKILARKKAELVKELNDLCNKQVVLGRIDELNRLDTGRHYGKDYQDSLDELDEYKEKRLAELSPTHHKQLQEAKDIIESFKPGKEKS